jgi:hypothetical protein
MMANHNLPEQDHIPIHGSIPATQGSLYTIITLGEIDSQWSEWLDGMTIRFIPEAGLTALTGLVLDQAALRSLLTKIWDLNLEIIAVFCPSRVNSSGGVR